MRHIRLLRGLSVSAVLIFGLQGSAAAGLYTGAEVDHTDTRLFFMGAESEGRVFANLVVSELTYDYQDGAQTVHVNSTAASPTVGCRIGGRLSFSVAAGLNWTEENKQRDTLRGARNDSDSSTGVVTQAGLTYRQPRNNYELLASYNASNGFVWSRGRGKHFLGQGFSLGGELFGMGNEDFHSQGVGALFELRGKRVSGLVKAGVSETGAGDSGGYAGIEFALPF